MHPALIYGHRGITPQRYAKDEAVSQKEAKGAADAAANALRGLKVGGRKKSVDSGDSPKSTDGGDSPNVGSRQNKGNSRLPWWGGASWNVLKPVLKAQAPGFWCL